MIITICRVLFSEREGMSKKKRNCEKRGVHQRLAMHSTCSYLWLVVFIVWN